jgi:HD domain
MNDRVEGLKAIGDNVADSVAREDWPEVSKRPTLAELFARRMHKPRFGLLFPAGHHGAQCARLALEAGVDEETVLACLLHDIGLAVVRADHGWWGAQLVEPYVSERVSWAIRYHQALRYYPDPSVGYEYPVMYNRMYGPNYKPPEYIEAAYKTALNHRWYMAARHITMYDDYSFDPSVPFSMDPFVEIIGRHFRQPAEGLGYDNRPTAHMWRTLIDPNKLL